MDRIDTLIRDLRTAQEQGVIQVTNRFHRTRCWWEGEELREEEQFCAIGAALHIRGEDLTSMSDVAVVHKAEELYGTTSLVPCEGNVAIPDLHPSGEVKVGLISHITYLNDDKGFTFGQVADWLEGNKDKFCEVKE